MAGTGAEEMCLQDAGSEHRHDFGQPLGAPSSRSSGDGEGSGQSLKGLFQCQNNTGHFAWCHLHSSCFGQCPELPCALFLWHRFNGRWVGGDKNRCCEKKLRRKHTMGRRGYGHSSAPEPCRALLWEAHSFGEGAVRSSSRLGPEGQEVAGLAPWCCAHLASWRWSGAWQLWLRWVALWRCPIHAMEMYGGWSPFTQHHPGLLSGIRKEVLGCWGGGSIPAGLLLETEPPAVPTSWVLPWGGMRGDGLGNTSSSPGLGTLL